jgi:hypothetical protein
MPGNDTPHAASVWRAALAVIERHRVAATILFLMVFPWLVPYHALLKRELERYGGSDGGGECGSPV